MTGMWSQQLYLPSPSLPLQIGAQQFRFRPLQARAAGWRSSTGRPIAELPLGEPCMAIGWRTVPATGPGSSVAGALTIRSSRTCPATRAKSA